MSQHLISVPGLAAVLADPALVVLDVRWGGPGSGDGAAEFAGGHVPGARYVDLESVLAEPHVPGAPGGRHPLPTTDRFEAGMREAGVSAGSLVVVYDAWRSISAARCWWLLRHHGHDRVLVLDGGWPAWQAAGLPVETGHSPVAPGDFASRGEFLPTLDADGAAELARRGVLMDGRPAPRFRGEGETIDPVAGHVPGAVSLPALELSADDSRMLPGEELRGRFAEVGVGTGTAAGAYCGSGVQASYLALAAAEAGLGIPALYAGSWSDWVTDASRPVAR